MSSHGVRAVQGIIFDLDGTLIDFEGVSHRALAAPLEKRGCAFSWELHARIIGTKTEDWSRTIVEATPELRGALTPADYAKEYFAALEGLYGELATWPGTLALLRALKARGFPLAIATSSPRVSFSKKMERFAEIRSLMDAVVTGDEVARGKPAPDIFQQAAARLGCDPRRCIVFEDSPAGLQGAREAGCLTVALPDERMPSNAPRFAELAPTWLLPRGIGTFNPEELVPAPRGQPAARDVTQATREYVMAQGLQEGLSDALSRLVEEKPPDGLVRAAPPLPTTRAPRRRLPSHRRLPHSHDRHRHARPPVPNPHARLRRCGWPPCCSRRRPSARGRRCDEVGRLRALPPPPARLRFAAGQPPHTRVGNICSRSCGFVMSAVLAATCVRLSR